MWRVLGKGGAKAVPDRSSTRMLAPYMAISSSISR